MIKSELVARLTARHPQLFHRDVERIVTIVLDCMSKALAEGRRVELRGFGAFSAKVRPSRMSRNPRTGKAVLVAEKRAPFFRTGKELRALLKGLPVVSGVPPKRRFFSTGAARKQASSGITEQVDREANPVRGQT